MIESKEEKFKKLESAYQRLVISNGNYETEAFTKILNEESKDSRRARVAEFIKTYKGNSLFVNYESLLPYYDDKTILNIVLSDLKASETEFYLYLFVPENEIDAVKEELEIVYRYKKDWITHILGSFKDDGYVIEIRDNRYFAANSFLKIYPDGYGFIVVDYDYHMEKVDFCLSDDITEELSAEIKKKVEKIISDKNVLICDDREFLKSFVVSYGFEWLGYHHSWGIDYQDYFLKKYPLRMIEKVMNIPVVKEKFANLIIPPNSINRFESDI